MLNKTGKKLSRILGAVIIILLSVQIPVGIAWSVLNFPFIQEFPETKDLFRLSSSLVLKSDTGIIYPALLLLVRTMTADDLVVSCVIMYLIQLGLAFVSWFLFAKIVLGFKHKWMDVWFSLAVVTCPFAMQCHMAVIEYSFISSFLCLLITYQISFVRDWKSAGSSLGVDRALRDISVTSLFWLILALTRIEFLYVGAIPVIILLIVILEHFKAGSALKKLAPLALVFVFALIILMSDRLFRDHGVHTFSDVVKRALYTRVAWSEDLYDQFAWPDYAVTLSNDEERYDILHRVRTDPGAVRTVFTPYVESCLGESGTSNAYLKWGIGAFSEAKKKVLKYIAFDMSGYIFPPFETEVILRGSDYPGYTAGNYDLLGRHTPVFAKYYLRATSVLYIALFPLSVLICLYARKKRLVTFTVSGIILVMITSSVIYTFYGSNVWDYKKAIFASCLWAAFYAFEGIALYESGIKEK